MTVSFLFLEKSSYLNFSAAKHQIEVKKHIDQVTALLLIKNK